MSEAVVQWNQIVGECGDYREGFVRTFRRYEGRATDEGDGQGRVVKVTMASFARHTGIPEQTFRRWIKNDLDHHNGGPAPANGTKGRVVMQDNASTARTNGAGRSSKTQASSRSNGGGPVRQAQRSLDTTEDEWAAVRQRSTESGLSTARFAGRVLAAAAEGDLEGIANLVGLPKLTEEERTARVEPIIDSCGVDDSFNEVIGIVQELVNRGIATLRTEEQRKVWIRLLKTTLSKIETATLNNHQAEGIYNER